MKSFKDRLYIYLGIFHQIILITDKQLVDIILYRFLYFILFGYLFEKKEIEKQKRNQHQMIRSTTIEINQCI